MAARRQMRTPGERTSGAWTGGCAIHPDGGDETDRTAGNSYTATPHNCLVTGLQHACPQIGHFTRLHSGCPVGMFFFIGISRMPPVSVWPRGQILTSAIILLPPSPASRIRPWLDVGRPGRPIHTVLYSHPASLLDSNFCRCTFPITTASLPSILVDRTACRSRFYPC